ncbi:MAG: 4-(cytidine 5'-diphospho)-2-C-methyl-D-erythritol kinase [Victivallales bacterium]|nr:4-(cytidine 5'-diphospho)-2-C-methyl-D-erythritol kinase [Victivallales bacterium]
MKAPAKINLFLKITGVRPDGYHTLENVFLPIANLNDEVTLEPSNEKGITLKQLGGPTLCINRSNLCLKAADAFCIATGLTPNVSILLTKRIPLVAGLGGGSSDAAAVLRLLNEYCDNPLSNSQLHEIASSLGADVPFFLNPTPSLGTGIGDILSPVQLNCRIPLVIVSPPFPLPVEWSFTHAKQIPADSSPTLADCLKAMKSGNLEALATNTRNDLEHAVFEKFPILQMTREAMLAAGALTIHVSGSGPSLFAISHEDKLTAIADACNKFFPDKTFIFNE